MYLQWQWRYLWSLTICNRYVYAKMALEFEEHRSCACNPKGLEHKGTVLRVGMGFSVIVPVNLSGTEILVT